MCASTGHMGSNPNPASPRQFFSFWRVCGTQGMTKPIGSFPFILFAKEIEVQLLDKTFSLSNIEQLAHMHAGRQG